MAQNTPIEWADKSWNPIRGCSRISAGCRNCYAERVAARFNKPGQPYEGLADFKIIGQGTENEHTEPHWTGKVTLVEKDLDKPLQWRAGIIDKVTGEKRPLRIFVNSMSDLFHKSVPYEWIVKIAAVMAVCPQHNFLVLTKRPQRMMELMSNEIYKGYVAYAVNHLQIRTNLDFFNTKWPLPNVWLGVSVEDQKTADERTPLLLQTPAAIRFISYEPALGPITARWQKWIQYKRKPGAVNNHLGGLAKLNWVICGGESGPNARPMHPDWARTVRDQGVEAGVPFFFKQWGNWLPHDARVKHSDRLFMRDDGRIAQWGDGTPSTEKDHNPKRWAGMFKVGKKKSGRLLDGKEWSQFPETKEVTA